MSKTRIFLILSLILISLSITFICQKDAFFNKHVVNDDANQYIFPFYRIKDHQLFQNDIFTEYSLRFNTKGTVFIYSLFSAFLDPLILSKILPFVLCCLSAIYFFLIGEKNQNIFVGFLAAIIFIMHSWTFSCFSGGHAKAFTFVLLSGFIYFLLKKRYCPLAVILFLQIFIYPPIAVISIFSLTILLFLRVIKKPQNEPILNKESVFFLSLVLVSVLVLFFLYLLPSDFMGPLFNFKEIVNMPEFHYGGRDPHFIESLGMLRKESIAENIIGMPFYSFPTWLLLSVSGFGLFLMLKRKITVEPILNIFCISGFFLFILAWIMLFNLFSPGRYLKYALCSYLIFLSALTIYKTFVEASNKRRFLRLFTVSTAIILIYFPFLDGNVTFFKNQGLYQFLSTLPKNALIAGHPFEMNEVPLFSKRKVFVQQELSLPYYKNYYQRIKQRTYDFFKLYYSSSTGEIKNICNQYEIDYIVVKKEHFSTPFLAKDHFYTNPFNDKAKQVVAQNIKRGFVLLDVPQEYRIYEDDIFFIVKIDDIPFSHGEY